MKKYKFVVYRSPRNRRWYFRLVASNGKRVAQSTQPRGYKRKGSAVKACYSICFHASKLRVEVRG